MAMIDGHEFPDTATEGDLYRIDTADPTIPIRIYRYTSSRWLRMSSMFDADINFDTPNPAGEILLPAEERNLFQNMLGGLARIQNRMRRVQMERDEHWMTNVDHIPWIELPPNYKILFMPPHGGATIRFGIKCNDKTVSVYYDTANHLGGMEPPYWEAYPINDSNAGFPGTTEGFKQMMEAIYEELGPATPSLGEPAPSSDLDL